MKRKTLLAAIVTAAVVFTSCAKGNIDMVRIPGKNYEMMKTEVTQKLYTSIMGENPSDFQGNDDDMKVASGETQELRPVENVSWYDAIYFCNKLSKLNGLKPVYAVNGETDVTNWGYTPHEGNWIKGEIKQNISANGYRLPTVEEWQYAARGGENYTYAGSDDLDEVGWYYENSDGKTHEVAQKKTNGYGLYDMSGNVWEWCWDAVSGGLRCNCGGSWYFSAGFCEVDNRNYINAYYRIGDIGFRVVRSLK